MIQNEKGFTLLDMLFVCGLIGIISVIAMPRLLLARQSANASSAIATMRAINSAQLTFALTCGGGFYAPKLTTLGTAPPGSNQAFLSPDVTSADTEAGPPRFRAVLSVTPRAAPERPSFAFYLVALLLFPVKLGLADADRREDGP